MNAADTIDNTIWGIVSQEECKSIRYHVQDGGSTDGTLEKLRGWQERIEALNSPLPSRVHFTFSSSRDSSMYEAIAKGFEQMDIPDTAMMGWCNADDVLWQGALSYVCKAAAQFPDMQWLTGWSSSFDELNRFKKINMWPFFPRQILISGLANGRHWPHLQQESTFWRKSFWDQVGGINTRLKFAGDWDLWRRFAQCRELYHLDRQLGAFYFRKGQKSSDLQSYYRECEELVPMDTRKHAFLKQLSQFSQTLEITRIVQDESGNLHLRTETLNFFIQDKILSLVLSLRLYFSILKKRHRAHYKRLR